MTLFVRDEHELVRSNISHHLEQGVDHVYVADNGSIDGTRDILEELSATGSVTVVDEPEHRVQQGEAVTRLTALATERGATWIFHDDADEFWFSSDGSLREVLFRQPSDVAAVAVDRYNLVFRPEDGRAWHERMVVRLRDPVHLPGMAPGPLGSKLAHRALPGVRVLQGGHELEHPEIGEPKPEPSLRILHAPVRDLAQFTRRVVFHGEAYLRSGLPREVGWVRRGLYDSYLDGSFDARLREMTFDDARLAAGLADGSLVFDDALRQAFRRHPPGPPDTSTRRPRFRLRRFLSRGSGHTVDLRDRSDR